MPRRPAYPRGITPVYRDGRLVGFRARLRAGGRPFAKRFKADATIDEMDRWREDTRAQARLGLVPEHPPGTFAADAARYLEAVRAMPTYTERASQIQLWVDEFGPRPRAEIQAVDIRRVRDRWLTVGPRRVQRWVLDRVTGRKVQTFVTVEKPLGASTVNHRLRALCNLYTVLDGRHAPNPAREVPEADEPDDEPRGLPVELVEAILAAVSDQGQAERGKARLDGASKARARLHALAWFGLPPAQLALLRKQDVDLEGKTAYIRRRRKGHGVEGQRRPITERAVEAAKMLEAADAWGDFDRGVVRRAWRRACAVVQAQLAAAGVAVDLAHVVPYQLRHSFADATLRATGSLDALQALLGHADKRTSKRYAKGAVPDWLAAAARLLEAFQGGKAAPEGDRKGDTDEKPETIH